MAVFISWSAENSKSHRVAQFLRDWIPKVIQRTECFLSSKDTGAGSVWLDTILLHLKSSHVGIICLTKENLQSSWIHFEAGAIAKETGKARLCPLLIDVAPANVVGPLTAFQMKQFDQSGVGDILQMVNESNEKPLDPSALADSYALRWPSLKSEIEVVASIPETTPAKETRPDRELLEEILNRVRTTTNIEPMVTWGGNVLSALRDDKADEMFKALLTEVKRRRPLIQSWIELPEHYRQGDTLVLAFPEQEQLAFESANRSNNKKFLEELAQELGFKIGLRLMS